jgi:hypothetical protein
MPDDLRRRSGPSHLAEAPPPSSASPLTRRRVHKRPVMQRRRQVNCELVTPQQVEQHRQDCDRVIMSRPVEDCAECPALAGVRNLGLDDPSPGRPDSPCNFGDRISRSLANTPNTEPEIGKRVAAENFWCDKGSLASVGAIESDTVAHGFELVECPSLGSFGVEAGEVICAGVVVEGSGVADVPDGRRGVLVDQVQVHPGQERVVLGEPAGQCVGQGRDFRPESTPEPVWDIQASNLALIRQELWLRATTRCSCP